MFFRKNKLLRSPVVIFILILACLCLTLPVRAETFTGGNGITVTVPDGWERAGSGFASANAEVTRIFDCMAEDPGQIKTVGWKAGGDGKVTAAFCISYQKSGISISKKTTRIL